MENDYPGIKPDKLLPLVQRMVGKKKKLSDLEIISGEWKHWIINNYKKGTGIPKGINKDKLPAQKRIKYITKQKTTNSVGQYFIQFIITIELGPLTVMVNSQERLLH